MKKVKQNRLLLLAAALLWIVSCKSPNYVDANFETEISDLYASIDGKGTQRLFEGRFSGDSILIDIDYHYPLDSDNEVDLSKLLVVASIPKDAVIVPSLEGLVDLSKPKNIKVTAGDGSQQEYVIKANKKGDASIKSAKLIYSDQLGEEVSLEGIITGSRVLFYALPDEVINNAKFQYTINRHAEGSIASGENIDLSTGLMNFTVNAPGDRVANYTIELLEPIKLEQGVGISRRLFKKSASDLGFSAHNNTGIAVSGEYLVVPWRTNPSVIKLFNRFTGEYVKDMHNPISSGMIFQVVSDSMGRIITTTYTPVNGAFQMYLYQDVNDSSPKQLLNYTHVSPSGITSGDRALGRKVTAYGDFNQEAVIVSSIAGTPNFYRWKIQGGEMVSATPELVNILSYPSTSLGLQNSMQVIGLSSNSNYFASYQFDELRYMNGNDHTTINAIDVEKAAYIGAIDFVEFNNARLLAASHLRASGSGAMDFGKLALYDVTDPLLIALKSTNEDFSLLKKYESEEISASANANATSDVCFGISADGETLQVYLLLTNGGILAQEFTIYQE